MRADITNVKVEDKNHPAFVLMDELGNNEHTPPFLAVFSGKQPNQPHNLDGEYSRDALLDLIRQLPDPR